MNSTNRRTLRSFLVASAATVLLGACGQYALRACRGRLCRPERATAGERCDRARAKRRARVDVFG